MQRNAQSRRFVPFRLAGEVHRRSMVQDWAFQESQREFLQPRPPLRHAIRRQRSERAHDVGHPRRSRRPARRSPTSPWPPAGRASKAWRAQRRNAPPPKAPSLDVRRPAPPASGIRGRTRCGTRGPAKAICRRGCWDPRTTRTISAPRRGHKRDDGDAGHGERGAPGRRELPDELAALARGTARRPVSSRQEAHRLDVAGREVDDRVVEKADVVFRLLADLDYDPSKVNEEHVAQIVEQATGAPTDALQED